MAEDPLQLRAQREKTDASLREERARTDEALANRGIYRRTDEVTRLEREETDTTIHGNREQEDDEQPEQEVAPEEVRKALEEERLKADEAIRIERERADEALRLEREKRAKLEAVVFQRERERTDVDLGHERRETDTVLNQERNAKTLAEDDLRVALERAREAVAARDAFLLVAAHELRTPLNTLQLQVQSFLSSASAHADEKTNGRLRRVQAQVDRLSKLVNDLLDVSRILGRRPALELADVDLAALVNEIVVREKESLVRAKCAIRLDAPGPVIGRWDRQRLDQVVTNLLSNAMKFGVGKPIRIAVKVDESTARLVVEDEGIGISPEDRSRIFNRFERAVSERNFGGLGLGLWIVRQVVEAHGGTITVDSEVGSGARFTVELPRSAPQAAGQ
jgi:signal transduction histidine kinase